MVQHFVWHCGAQTVSTAVFLAFPSNPIISMSGTPSSSPHLTHPFHHINIYVRDQDRSLSFYLDQLGFHLAYDAKLQTGERLVAVAPPDGSAVLSPIVPKRDTPEHKLIRARCCTRERSAGKSRHLDRPSSPKRLSLLKDEVIIDKIPCPPLRVPSSTWPCETLISIRSSLRASPWRSASNRQ
jgi:hypothetical protein